MKVSDLLDKISTCDIDSELEIALRERSVSLLDIK
jgi:hypothetical protein